ncbi:hypothetical protein B0J11DRAFT_602362 [Dendryphion nanum]|uniref:Uncharacterized protein n=1 Tax=Dendryphion nanum TaxID=256645 RepID=A0A9P9IRU4_9PLEO|nr:hypothetical protein B0J11DRAFT_602362 [Dendryphion nanum]
MTPPLEPGVPLPIPVDSYLLDQDEQNSESLSERFLSPAFLLDYSHSQADCQVSPNVSRRHHLYGGVANGGTEYPIPNVGTDSQRKLAHDPRYTSPHMSYRNTRLNTIRYGFEQRDRGLHADALEHSRGLMSVPLRPLSEYNSRTPTNTNNKISMQQENNSSPTPDPRSSISSPYSTFGGGFRSSEQACEYRRRATKFNRKPYRAPDSDTTIPEIESNRDLHVRRIYEAMINGDLAQDNPNSIAMRRWVQNPYYPSQLVEAYAHKVFDCLMSQAREGFRGWHHNDYASDDRKGGEGEDKNLDCAERLDSIVRSLQQEKTICEDVMNSACQIRMFVNAPRAYAARKSANRVGNSKRKKATDFPASRPMKRTRLNARSISSNLLQATPELPTTVLQSHPRQFLPLHLLAPKPNLSAVDMNGHQLVDEKARLMSPPLPYSYDVPPSLDSLPPQGFTSFMSSTPHSHHSNTLPLTPDDILNSAANSSLSAAWDTNPNAGASQCTFFPETHSSEPYYWDHINPPPSHTDPNLIFDFEPDLANGLPTFPIGTKESDEGNYGGDFQTFWDSQHGVQSFPSQGLNEGAGHS